MIKYFLTLGLTFFFFGILSAQSFKGKISFKILVLEPDGNTSDQTGKSVVYFNDSLIRRENDSQFGQQVYLTDVNSGMTHLLMNFMGKDYAIFMGADKFNVDDTSLYDFQPAKGKQKIEGYKCEKVTYKKAGKELSAHYTKDISSKYNNGSFRHLDGFALSYEVADQGVIYQYKCVEVLDYTATGTVLSRQLFTIPPQYEIIDLDDFMEMVQKNQ